MPEKRAFTESACLCYDEREAKLLEDLAAHADFARLAAWGVPARELLAIAGQVLDARMARARRDYARAETGLCEAARLQDAAGVEATKASFMRAWAGGERMPTLAQL